MQTNAQMKQDAAKAFARADAALNTAYKALADTLDPAGRASLQKAQRAWIGFRDAESDFAGDRYRGGTMASLEILLVRTSLTQSRTDQLVEHRKSVP